MRMTVKRLGSREISQSLINVAGQLGSVRDENWSEATPYSVGQAAPSHMSADPPFTVLPNLQRYLPPLQSTHGIKEPFACGRRGLRVTAADLSCWYRV